MTEVGYFNQNGDVHIRMSETLRVISFLYRRSALFFYVIWGHMILQRMNGLNTEGAKEVECMMSHYSRPIMATY